MRQNISLTTILVILFLSIFQSCSTDSFEKKLKSGDIIFQTSKSQQSKAIQLATHSKYSHVGIIYVENDNILVYEAVQPVKLTPLHEWINRGEKKHFVVKRLKESEKYLTSSNLSKMKSIGEKYIGKNYDIYFEWSNERIYCSELVWKIYKEAVGIEIGKLQTLKEFDLENDIVKEIMEKRYGETIPMDEKVISPAEMFNSNILKTVFSN
ncbi:MAG: YiiX family permuted papain-like enzyme [Bacteroidetes bacterium]|nr:YiiX family permuted papain-like enzyme [Bacteroidota bacterium]